MENLPILIAGEERIVRVLVNLLSKAGKCAPKGGHIRIRGQAPRERRSLSYIFTVNDDGIGISEKDIDRIFMEGVSIAKVGRVFQWTWPDCMQRARRSAWRSNLGGNEPSQRGRFFFAIPTDLPPK